MPSELRAFIAAPSLTPPPGNISGAGEQALSALNVEQSELDNARCCVSAPSLPAVSRPDDRGTTDPASIPGKLPVTGCGKLAVSTAWTLECDDKLGRRATAKVVMARLIELAKEGTHPETLMEPGNDGRSVEWATSKGKKKNYSIDALEKTLVAWYESRA